MYLKRLEIQGFKSFAKKTTLEFEPGVTSIVGPNGSGKSNVADSLRWVLGEQSARLLRGKKSDDVIFAGSDKKTKLSFAEVVATFDNGDHRIPVDASEVSIGRRIDRSGESEYLINGNKVRLLDIVDLVLRSNIGTSRYTVIGQGTIDQLVLAGPTEIKSLIDEASGVKTYYMKREKTLRRLEQTAQNLMRAKDLINEIEPRLKSLRRQAKRMEARETIQTELRVYQREWYSQSYHGLRAEINTRHESLQELQNRRAGLEAAIAQHLEMVERKEGETRDSNTQFTAVRGDLGKLQERKNKLLEQLSLIRGKMESQKTAQSSDPATLTVELHTAQGSLAETQARISESVAEEKNLQGAIQKLKESLAVVSGALNSVYERLSAPETIDFELVAKEIDSFESVLEDFYASLTDTVTIGEVKAKAEQIKMHFSSFAHTARKAMKGSGSAANEAQVKLQELMKQKDQLSHELQALENSLSRIGVQKEFLEKQRAGLEQQLLHLNLELKKATSTTADDFLKNLIAEEDRVKQGLQDLAGEMDALERDIAGFMAEEATWKQQLQEAEKVFREKQSELGTVRDQESAVSVEKAKFDTHMESLTQEIVQALGEDVFRELIAEPMKSGTEGLEEKIARLKHQLELVGGVDELTIQEYKETEERHTGLTSQVSDLERGMQDLRQIIEELDEHIKKQFNESFHKINEKFEFYFRMLFNGGRGTLSVIRVQPDDFSEDSVETAQDQPDDQTLRPEEKLVQKYEHGPDTISGIDIKATPPGKKLSSIQALSGGERALTSIALLCSMLACFPSPFVVLDEVDAALDEANTIRFGQILGTLAHQTQFVTITHNRETMAQSSMLYGVTMGDDGVSKLLSIKFDQATSYAK